MPRVSEAHLAARRQQILDAAARCFIRSGFHATTMQDVIAEAGLSVGAFYRYFRSKDELIQAIAGAAITEVTAAVDTIVLAEPVPPLARAIGDVLAIVEANSGQGGFLRIGIQVWGEATHNAEMRGYVYEIYRQVRGRFETLARRARDAGQLPPDADPEHVGAALFGFIPGFALQWTVLGAVDRQTYAAGIAALLAATPAAIDR
jgi:AcrR family transcriptional regulator